MLRLHFSVLLPVRVKNILCKSPKMGWLAITKGNQ